MIRLAALLVVPTLAGFSSGAAPGFILLLRRQPDGKWLIAADMDNGTARR